MVLWGKPIESPLKITPELIRNLMPDFRHVTKALESRDIPVDRYRVTINELGKYVVEALPPPEYSQ